MKVQLLYRDRAFDPKIELPWHAEMLAKDLALPVVFETMAGGDATILDVARRVILTGLDNDVATIGYRQQVLRDCLDHPEAVRELYAFACATVDQAKKQYLGMLARYPEWVLSQSVSHMTELLGMIRSLKKLATRYEPLCTAPGWTAFFTRLRNEVDDAYLASVDDHLRHLSFRECLVLSAALGRGNKGIAYRLHRPPLPVAQSWLARLGGLAARPVPDPQAATAQLFAASTGRGGNPRPHRHPPSRCQPDRHCPGAIGGSRSFLFHGAAKRTGLLCRLP